MAVLYIPSKTVHYEDEDVLSSICITQWHHNDLHGRWKTMDGNSSYTELRAMLFETFIVEESVYRKLIKEDDCYEGLNRYHEDMYLCTPLLFKARKTTVETYYNHMKTHCQGAEDFLLQTSGDWDDIYRRDSELFDDEEQGWQGLVALTSDRQYMGHVYIRRGSRFGPTGVDGRQTRWDQLDYMEMLGIRQSLRNVSSCQGPNTLRLSVSKILLCGVKESLRTNHLMGVDVYNPLATMTKILKALMFQSIGCAHEYNIRHMRANVDELSRTLQTQVHFLNQPPIFAPCKSFVTATVSVKLNHW